MCSWCIEKPEDREARKLAGESYAKKCNALADFYRALGSGRVDPHAGPTQSQALAMKSIARDLLEWVL